MFRSLEDECAPLLQFDSLTEVILNGQLIMTLPATFNKVQGNQRKVTHEDTVAAKVDLNEIIAGRRGSSIRSQLLKTTSSATSSN